MGRRDLRKNDVFFYLHNFFVFFIKKIIYLPHDITLLVNEMCHFRPNDSEVLTKKINSECDTL